MRFSILKLVFFLLCSIFVTIACKDKKSSLNSKGNFKVSGSVANREVVGLRSYKNQFFLATKTITHVIASSARGETFIGQVAQDGTFSLDIDSGTPYTFVLVDDSQIGEEMIVGILKPDAGATGLDTLIPVGEGSVTLGEIEVDGSAQQGNYDYKYFDVSRSNGSNYS